MPRRRRRGSDDVGEEPERIPPPEDPSGIETLSDMPPEVPHRQGRERSVDLCESLADTHPAEIDSSSGRNRRRRSRGREEEAEKEAAAAEPAPAAVDVAAAAAALDVQDAEPEASSGRNRRRRSRGREEEVEEEAAAAEPAPAAVDVAAAAAALDVQDAEPEASSGRNRRRRSRGREEEAEEEAAAAEPAPAAVDVAAAAAALDVQDAEPEASSGRNRRRRSRGREEEAEEEAAAAEPAPAAVDVAAAADPVAVEPQPLPFGSSSLSMSHSVPHERVTREEVSRGVRDIMDGMKRLDVAFKEIHDNSLSLQQVRTEIDKTAEAYAAWSRDAHQLLQRGSLAESDLNAERRAWEEKLATLRKKASELDQDSPAKNILRPSITSTDSERGRFSYARAIPGFVSPAPTDALATKTGPPSLLSEEETLREVTHGTSPRSDSKDDNGKLESRVNELEEELRALKETAAKSQNQVLSLVKTLKKVKADVAAASPGKNNSAPRVPDLNQLTSLQHRLREMGGLLDNAGPSGVPAGAIGIVNGVLGSSGVVPFRHHFVHRNWYRNAHSQFPGHTYATSQLQPAELLPPLAAQSPPAARPEKLPVPRSGKPPRIGKLPVLRSHLSRVRVGQLKTRPIHGIRFQGNRGSGSRNLQAPARRGPPSSRLPPIASVKSH